MKATKKLLKNIRSMSKDDIRIFLADNRKVKGLSSEKIAAAAGVTTQTVRNSEDGRCLNPYVLMYEIALLEDPTIITEVLFRYQTILEE